MNAFQLLQSMFQSILRCMNIFMVYIFRDPQDNQPQQSDDPPTDTPPDGNSTCPPLTRDVSPLSHVSRRKETPEALTKLQESLREHRVASNEPTRKFVPAAILQHLVDHNVEAILEQQEIVDAESAQWFAHTISEQATRLFATLVDMKLGKEAYIIQLLAEGITDESLPFTENHAEEPAGSTLVTRQGRQIQALKDWDSRSVESFVKKQYRMLSPTFRKGEHYPLGDLHILPFIKSGNDSSSKSVGSGGFGEVFQEYIHPDHHAFGDSSSQDAHKVAVKRVYRDTDFELECKAYRDLGPSCHPHLINLLFTYRKGRHCHLVFPWANGSLRRYWKDNPDPRPDRRLLIWFLTQMVGITSGLTFFHAFRNAKTEEHRFGRHGDIKAENILWFSTVDGLPILKIADLGLSNIRGRDSRSNVDPNTVIVSPTYSPPDVYRRCLISRKWDIWSLGCLLLEFVTYLVLGNKAVDLFAKQRKETDSEWPELSTDAFYSVNYESVKPSVASWTDHLKQSPRCSQMLCDILNLVLHEMLLIKPDARSTSLEICQRLKEMLSRAEKNEQYLMSPNLEIESTPSKAIPNRKPVAADFVQSFKATASLETQRSQKSYSWSH